MQVKYGEKKKQRQGEKGTDKEGKTVKDKQKYEEEQKDIHTERETQRDRSVYSRKPFALHTNAAPRAPSFRVHSQLARFDSWGMHPVLQGQIVRVQREIKR